MDYPVPMDYPKWTALKFCGKHEFNDARTWSKDEIDQQSQLRINCDATDLISDWTFVIKHWRTRQADREAEV